MFWANRPRTARVLSAGVASSVVVTVALVVAAPAEADEIYARPWDNTMTLAGHGYGHGHGMSQWGAYGAAKVFGKTWKQIVAFYYPGTVLATVSNKTIRVQLQAVRPGNLHVYNAAGLQLASGGGTPVALPQSIGGVPITRYRVRTLSTGWRLRVEAYSSAGWTLYKDNVTSPAVFSNPNRGNLVDVLVDVRQSDGTIKRVRRTYRGSIYANWAAKTSDTSPSLTTVNKLPMESYLRAVVPAEMPASWHIDAVAAQAVAARSYANHDRENAPAGRTYDTCDTTSCQMYSGLPAEVAASNTAIAATAGQTLTYQGAAAFTQFSASNGGWSSAGSRPYLVAKVDPYDGAIPNSANSWTDSVTVASIEAKWPSIGTYRRLRIISRDGNGQWGGRVLRASVEGSTGSIAVTGTTLRTVFGLRSEWFIPTLLRSAPSYPRDFSGDKLADVLGVVASSGDLRMQAGNGASGWKSSSVIGTGFGAFSKVFTVGTWDADALSDVMVMTPEGVLWLYPGTTADPLGPPVRIGPGWGIYNMFFPVGDFSGDGRSDFMARRPNGDLMLYSGNGTGGFLKGVRKIGATWAGFTSVFSPGDFDGDSKSDVFARTAGGTLYLYPGTGSGGWLPRRLIGGGWNAFSAIVSPGDFNGDRAADFLARGKDGTVWMYPGNGTGGFLPRQAVATGWKTFSTVLP